MNRIAITLLIVSACATIGLTVKSDPPWGPLEPSRSSVVTVEDGVMMGNVLPDWMEICQETGVYGNPYGLNEPFYTVYPGEIVRIHDASHDNTWAMIDTARWVPLNALCWGE